MSSDNKSLEMSAVNVDQIPAEEPIRVTDIDEQSGLKMYHYVTCDEQSDDIVKNTRGVARNSEGKMVLKTFNFTPEWFSDEGNLADRLKVIFGEKNPVVYSAKEGTLLRVWNYEGKWMISSHKKLDAHRSRWGCSISHADMFSAAIASNQIRSDQADVRERILALSTETEVVDSFFQTLRQDRIYTFVAHSIAKNRIVCNPPLFPMVYFTGEFDAQTFILLDENTSGIDRPEQIRFPGTMTDAPEHAIAHVRNIDPKQEQGLLIYYGVGTSEFGSVKITSSTYRDLAAIRANTPSIRFRYLQVRNDENAVRQLMDLYPECATYFQEYENIMHDIARNIYQKYLERFVYRNKDGTRDHVTLPQEQWFVAKDLHDRYLQDPVANKISMPLVIDYIDSLPPVRINFLIRAQKARNAGEQEDADKEKTQ